MLVSGSGEWSRGTKRGRRKDPKRTSESDDDLPWDCYTARGQ